MKKKKFLTKVIFPNMIAIVVRCFNFFGCGGGCRESEIDIFDLLIGFPFSSRVKKSIELEFGMDILLMILI
jgi:hypothetical protein